MDELDPKIVLQYKRKIIKTLHPDSEWKGGFNIYQVDKTIMKLNTKSNLNYYFEIGIYAIKECTLLAEYYGGDYGEEFYFYFEKLYEEIISQVCIENLENRYRDKLKEIMETAFEGYGYKDRLQDTYFNYLG